MPISFLTYTVLFKIYAYRDDGIHHTLLMGVQIVTNFLKGGIAIVTKIKYENTQDTKITSLAINNGDYGLVRINEPQIPKFKWTHLKMSIE